MQSHSEILFSSFRALDRTVETPDTREGTIEGDARPGTMWGGTYLVLVGTSGTRDVLVSRASPGVDRESRSPTAHRIPLNGNEMLTNGSS